MGQLIHKHEDNSKLKATSEDQGGFSQEKLIEKYKSALGIAQKAKNARDEALKSNKVLQGENEILKEKILTIEKQFKTAEEMLGALTEQKLKLAMEIDDLKKEKRIYLEELKTKESIMLDAENYKNQYNKLLKENEELISSTESKIAKMKKENDDLKRHNDTLKQLCNNIQMEKSEIDKNLSASIKRLSYLEENQNILNLVLSKKYNAVVDEFRNWAKVIDLKEDSFEELEQLKVENETLKSEKDKSNSTIKSLMKDKENMEMEIVELNERIKLIYLELDAANADKDKMLNNLEKVSLETKRLIENSEGLTLELQTLKEERASLEQTLTSKNTEILTLNKLIEENVTALNLLNLEHEKFLKLENEKKAIDIDKEGDLKNEHNEFFKEGSLDKERSVNIELKSLQEDLKAFSAEIESYKDIVREGEKKLQEALETISEREKLLRSREEEIAELKSSLIRMEYSQVAITESLLESRKQLSVALEELEAIERLKDDLENDGKEKDEEFMVACHKLESKEKFVKDITEGIERLRSEIYSLHKIESLDEEFDFGTSDSEEYIIGLKKCLDAVTYKLYLKYREEIDDLKDIINEYQENNEALAINNDKLSKQAKELLNEQADYDNSLVQKLKMFKENLLHQLKEKQSVITNLESEVIMLKQDIVDKVNVSESIEKEKNELKSQIEQMNTVSAEENQRLIERALSLEVQIKECVAISDKKNETIRSLENKIISLENIIVEHEETQKNLSEKVSELSNLIDTLNCDWEKENKELKNIVLSMNSKPFGWIDPIIEGSVCNTKETKGMSQLELHKIFLKYLSENIENFKKEEQVKESIKSELLKLSDNKKLLIEESVELKKEITELSSNLSIIREAIAGLIELINQKEVSLGSKEVNDITKLLPQSFKELFEGLKLREKELDSRTTFNKEELENKLLYLEAVIKSKEEFIKDELDKKDSSINALKEEVNSSKKKFEEISILNNSLNFDLSNFKENVERLRSEYSHEKDALLDNNNKLHNELKDVKELLDFKSLELRENNRIWAGRFSSLKVALMGINKTRKEIKNHFKSVEASFNSFINEIREPLEEKVDLVVESAVSASKAELIGEMHQMNQALKERGETISKLEFAVTDCHAKMKQLTAVSDRLQSELSQVRGELQKGEDAIKEKDEMIKQLEAEIEQLRDSLPDNDCLSTSTISRTEEHSRLKDIEDSFEDRYTKLKLIAVKLKKRGAELSHTLESERTKAAADRNELQDKISSMSMAIKNTQKIQELLDESLDERDRLKEENKKLKNSLEELKNNEQTLKSKILNLEQSNQNIPVMKKHIDSLNGTIKESKAEIQKLQMEIKAEAIKYEEMKKNSSKLEATVQELTRNFEEAKQQGKNNNVLELEMKNYEKIIADLSSQLNIERALIKSLKSENEALSNVKIGLEEQISILEKQIEVEEERSKDSRDQLAIYQKKVEEKNGLIEDLNMSIGEVKSELSKEKNKNEAVTLEMSAITSEFSKKEMTMLSKISSFQDQIRSLETSLLSNKQELATSKREIDHLSEEYESYKLRAQTILAKKKGELVTQAEKEAREECERLKGECSALEVRLDVCMSEMETLNTRISSLNLEKARSDKRYDEMRSALQQKLTDYDVLNTEFYNLKMTHEIEIEQLKAELTKKKNEYQAELTHHKKTIDNLMLEFKQKEEEALKDKSESSVNVFSNFPESILPFSEREDGEGSESVPSPKTRRNSTVVPLDVLLNSPDESKVNVLQEQIEKLQKDLSRSEVRARHLSSLLSEAEKDSARNLHQNKVLKEEVRRLERAVERQPHVANTEYLKNVIFKFVTLPTGDERSRLVPVLDTLLKFSPDEANKLSAVAKGETQAGWGSYFQSLTGL